MTKKERLAEQPTASTNARGLVRVGSNLSIDGAGILSGQAGGGGGSSSSLAFDVVTPTTAAELNTAIVNCTKPILYVLGSTLNINQAIIINGKSNLRIVAPGNLELVLTSWNDGVQGIILDLQNSVTNITVDGFRFNCPLPANSGNGDGGGYGLVAARGAVAGNITGLKFQNCYFTSPNLRQNGFSFVCWGWGGSGIFRNVTIKNCEFKNIKRMTIEVINQEGTDTNGTKRFFNFKILNNIADNKEVVGAFDSQFISFDGPGNEQLVKNNVVTNVGNSGGNYTCVFECVGTENVKFENNSCDYDDDFTGIAAGYGFTNGQDYPNYGPRRIFVDGGRVRVRGRGLTFKRATFCVFTNVTVESKSPNTLITASNNQFRKCHITANSTNQFLMGLEQNSQFNLFADNYLANEISSDNSGGRCIFVLYDSGSNIKNRILFNRMYQVKNASNAFYENPVLDFSPLADNEKVGNVVNNPTGTFNN